MECREKNGGEKISVIIPMYNAEGYIRQCLQSVAGQTYQNLQILVIDDGSTDQSPDICRELGATDRRIQVLRQENKGVSAARNHGLDAAEGKYVFFIDSDDCIHPMLLETLVCQMEEYNIPFAFCDYAKVDSLQMEEAMRAHLTDDAFDAGTAQWRRAEGEETERLFHGKYLDKMSGSRQSA